MKGSISVNGYTIVSCYSQYITFSVHKDKSPSALQCSSTTPWWCLGNVDTELHRFKTSVPYEGDPKANLNVTQREKVPATIVKQSLSNLHIASHFTDCTISALNISTNCNFLCFVGFSIVIQLWDIRNYTNCLLMTLCWKYKLNVCYIWHSYISGWLCTKFSLSFWQYLCIAYMHNVWPVDNTFCQTSNDFL